MKEKIKSFFKENYKFLIFWIILIIAVNIELPYYIEAPGGTINLTKRIDKDYDKSKGSLNMLYVTEMRGNIVTIAASKLINSWDLYEIKEQQISNETSEELYIRNRIMLDNSIQNATFVAAKYANKKINIKEKKNIVIATTKENGIKIGDEILKISTIPVDNINTIKTFLEDSKPKDIIPITIKRDDKEKIVNITLDEDKLIGVMMVTNYTYDLEDEININFKSGEGGSSGGLILSLGIYSELTKEDLLKGRHIAGTGTIDEEGNVGEIDGIKYKIAGAVKEKMDLILVSPANYEEALQVVKDNNYKIEIVCVKTFEEAIEYLRK